MEWLLIFVGARSSRPMRLGKTCNWAGRYHFVAQAPPLRVAIISQQQPIPKDPKDGDDGEGDEEGGEFDGISGQVGELGNWQLVIG